MAWRAFTVRLGGVALGGALALGVVGGALAAEESVTIEGFAFGPADLTVSVGDTVTWSNQDSAAHTATADGGAFDTGNISAGSSDSVTFSKAGTFAYHCSIHPSMSGTIRVSTSSGGTGGATIPPTDTSPVAAPSSPEPSTVVEFLAAILAAAGLVGLWLGGVFARERIRRD
jgi:plastocyanin